MFFRSKVRRQLAAEIEAQFAAFASTGLTLDHVNAHKHFHLHPTIGRLAVEIGKRYGMKAMRSPIEPPDVIRRIEPGTTGGDLERFVGARLRERLWVKGVWSPDAVFGLAWSGAMHAKRVAAILDNLRGGVSEIYLHPATCAYSGSVRGYRYSDELTALMAPDVMAKTRGVKLGRFADFAGG